MNVRRAIEWTCVGARFVPPLQGGEVCSAHDLGLGAARLTPGCHIAGFQPSDERVLCICHRFEARLARPFPTFRGAGICKVMPQAWVAERLCMRSPIYQG